MSKKQWMVLLMLFLTYLLLGASIFYHIERPLELEKVRIAKNERIEINALLKDHYEPAGGHDQHEILDKLTKYCGKSVHNYSEHEVDPLKWDFYNSFYFAYTVVSTIGYGNLAPTNMLGRVLMIFYALVGIPMNGILLAQLGEFFGQVFVTAVRKYKIYKQNQNEYSKKSLTSLEKRRAGLAMQIFMYLLPGFIMFIFFPAFLFSYYEGWTYDEAVYYAFVTLTTIGFGDYVAGQDNTKGSGVWFGLYKTFLICWISFGLGYIVMIMTFIGRGMTSKKVARLEHKLALKLKHTQSKIWNEFNEEVDYLRRVFNELQLSKVKRVYVDEYDYDTPPPQFPRSNSFPDLRDLVYGGLEPPTPPQPRRRANSEVVPVEAQVARVVSETDLQRIDKHATFATHAMVQPAELLARLVNILGYIPPPPDDDETTVEAAEKNAAPAANGGVQGFSEKDILASESPWSNANDTRWKIGGDPIRRSRATSEVRLDRPEMFVQPDPSEWTWSGPSASTKIQEIMKARKSAPPPEAKEASAAVAAARKSRFLSLGLGLPKSVHKALVPRWMRQLSGKKSTAADHSVSVNDVEASVSADEQEFASQSHTPGGRHTVFNNTERRNSYSRPYFTHTGGSNLLEETSVADFLRALTALHTRVGAVPDELAAARKPQRKLGTASLTPPKLPSLLTLFSPPPGHSQSQQNTVTAAAANAHNKRRFSLRTVENSATSTPLYQRRATQGAQAMPRPVRRFSLRPVPAALQHSYSSTPSHVVDDRQSPPAYSGGFMTDCLKKPLVEMEGAPGISSPMVTSSPSGRRFSLRPAQIGVPPAPSGSSSSSLAAAAAAAASTAAKAQVAAVQPVKAIPRWKAGMLQRQISQKNMQHRVRAFSLSDVNSEESDRQIGISPLALHDNARTITSGQGQQLSLGPKTVTIVSPNISRMRSEYQQRSRTDSDASTYRGTNPFGPTRSLRRYNSDIESVSSKSSSHSSKSLDRDASTSRKSDSSSASSRKSSDESISRREEAARELAVDEYKWDFDDNKPEEAAVPLPPPPPPPPVPNDDILAAIVKESDLVTRRLSEQSLRASDSLENKEASRKSSTTSRRSDWEASSRKSSFVSVETWAEARSRKSSSASGSRSRESSTAASEQPKLEASTSLVEIKLEMPGQPEDGGESETSLTEVRIDIPSHSTDEHSSDGKL